MRNKRVWYYIIGCILVFGLIGVLIVDIAVGHNAVTDLVLVLVEGVLAAGVAALVAMYVDRSNTIPQITNSLETAMTRVVNSHEKEMRDVMREHKEQVAAVLSDHKSQEEHALETILSGHKRDMAAAMDQYTAQMRLVVDLHQGYLRQLMTLQETNSQNHEDHIRDLMTQCKEVITGRTPAEV